MQLKGLNVIALHISVFQVICFPEQHADGGRSLFLQFCLVSLVA